ncbi:MAG: transporter substrate-binding domain-containing protein [Pseudomonadota bacterium]
MKKFLMSAVAAVLFAGAAQAQDVVRMGTEGAYPPYNFINDNGQIDGFEREVGDKLCELAELNCEWVTNEWDSIIPNLVSGNYDTIIAGMSITEERDQVIDFTQAYFPPDPSAFVALSGAADSVMTGVVAAQVNTIQAGHIAASPATLVEFATPDETIAAVKSGEADAVFADKAFLEPLVAQSNGELAFVGADVELGGGVGIGVRESDGELKAKLDAAIATMKADGSLAALIAKWFEGREITFD